MSVEVQHFKVSTGLKDLIGRDLITDDFVAVFELVKNAFDAGATKTRLTFATDTITISDNGKGMTRDDILNKWLFVAYSAKKDGTEDADYRDKIGEGRRIYAGAKGVGRFSCDSLGAVLKLSTKADHNEVQILDVDWRNYEHDPKEEFAHVGVSLTNSQEYPEPKENIAPRGTVLRISKLRAYWDRDKLKELRRALSKLINPFSNKSSKFEVEILAPDELAADELVMALSEATGTDTPDGAIVNGIIQNSIMQALAERTTVVRVTSVQDGKYLETELEDRGENVYRIREPNPYAFLKSANFSADVYFLNRSAKTVFTRRMGIRSIDFGAIFVFRNGFRVFPIGSEDDDFFGINKRKQQGQRRFLGTRELIGRVDVDGVDGFEEATSRNGGFIRSPEVSELIDAVVDKCVKRLERYIVDISWKDEFDKDQADTSRMRLDESSAKITQLVSRLASTEGVELLDFNPDLVRIVDEKSESYISSFKALELLAERTGDRELLTKVDDARARIEALQAAEAAAREAEKRADERAAAAERATAEAKDQLIRVETALEDERGRNQFLVAAASLDYDTIMNLHHQIGIHAAAIHNSIKLMSGKLRRPGEIAKIEIIDFIEKVAFRNSQILTAARFATRGGYKEQVAAREDDLVIFIRDYTALIANVWAPSGVAATVDGAHEGFSRKFKPIEIGIIIDNLVSNSAKFGASEVLFNLSLEKRGSKTDLVWDVTDDGSGWSSKVDPLSHAFEKGVTTSTAGSGLGLYHIKQIITSMGGTIDPLPGRYNDRSGAHIQMRIPA